MELDNSMLSAVKKARSLEETGSIDLAINSYLDAAQIAVNMIKQSSNESRRDWLKKISNDIISHVKYLKQNKPAPKLIEEKKSKPELSYMMLISNGGTQILGHSFSDDEGENIAKNDILFSSAITAIGSIFNETVQKSIEEIKLDDMWLHFIKRDEFISIIFTENVNQRYIDAHNNAVSYLETNYSEEISRGISKGVQINVDSELSHALNQFFEN